MLLGLYAALQDNIPPVFSCIVPHNNKSTISDMEDWIGSMKDTWTEKKLHILLCSSNFDSKGLNVLEKLSQRDENSIRLDVDGWLIYARQHNHRFPINPMGDLQHGIKLARAQLLYVDKIYSIWLWCYVLPGF